MNLSPHDEPASTSRGWPAAIMLATLTMSSTATSCTVRELSDPGNLVAPTVDDDPTLPALDVNDTRIHLESRGPAGAPVILTLHGGPGGDYRYMLGLADPAAPGSLVADHRVVFWDQRGTGLSRRHAESSLSMDRYLADLEALVDQLAPNQQVVLLGHSWGGAYAAWYIGRHPERVRAAVLIDPQALTHDLYVAHGSPAPTNLLAEWINDPLWSRELVSPNDHASADFFLTGVELGTDLPRFGSHSKAPMFRPGCAVFRALDFSWFDDTAYDFTSGLSTYPGRVEILAGTDDEVLGYAFQQRQAPLFLHAELVALDGDGHNDPLLSSARRTIALTRAFLDGVEGRTP